MVGELLVVGEAKRVGAGERDELLHGEALGGNHGDEAGDAGVGVWELSVGRGRGGGEPVLAAEAEQVEGPLSW